MGLGGVPASVSVVAPPARIDCPAIDVGKKQRRQPMNQYRLGIVPLERSQSSGRAGKIESCEERYERKSQKGFWADTRTNSRLPSKNWSPLCPGNQKLRASGDTWTECHMEILR